jgi:hypothetical protein
MPGFAKGQAINATTLRSIYPDAPGSTVGGAATSSNVGDYTTGQSSNVGYTGGATGSVAQGSTTATAASGGLFGRPVVWYLTLIVLFFALSFVAKKAGSEEDFKNISLSGYNFLTITITAMIGFTLAKIAVNKFPVPGLTDFVNGV